IVRTLQLKLFQSYQRSRGLSQAATEEGYGGAIPTTMSNDTGGGAVVHAIEGTNTTGQDDLAAFSWPPELDYNFDFSDFNIFQLNVPHAEGPSDSASSSMHLA